MQANIIMEETTVFNGHSWRVFTTNVTALSSNVITALKVDKLNRIWVGTSKGIYLIENDILTEVSFDLQDPSVVGIVESSNGIIWTALNGGIAKLNGSSWQLFTILNSGLKDNYPLCIEIDNLDKVWIGSRHNGISIFDNSNWSCFPTSSLNIAGIESGVNSICFAEDGTVWAGTISLSLLDFGKIVYRKNTVWYSYTNDDLNVNLVRQIVSLKGNIVFATKQGLGLINKSGNFNYYKSGNTKFT